MNERTYYSMRKGLVEPIKMDFRMLKKAFLHIYQQMDSESYFMQATGYHCVDAGEFPGSWGSDIETFFYLKLKMKGIWPIASNINSWDEPTLFTVIEFLYDYVSEPLNRWYHSWDNCGWHCIDFNTEKGRVRYRSEINNLLKEYDKAFELSENGEILEIAPTGLETLVDDIEETDDKFNIDNRIQAAISKYRRYSANLDDKKDAIRQLADVLEFLKKDGIRLDSKDDRDLFTIINSFDIRHHNKSQQSDYKKDVWYDWMFYTFLSSINVLLKIMKD